MSKYPTVTYKGKPIKYSDNGLVTRLMREATKEELQSVDSYINSISERVYTKTDLIKELEEIKEEIKEQREKEYKTDIRIGMDEAVYILDKRIKEIEEK